ncbi:MAG: hypothetical protein C5B49_08350 [Bdellovibrio sp.]|nr:MAG: hypothetical protein C5B49_08350 [Bdellovibrio sp.]
MIQLIQSATKSSKNYSKNNSENNSEKRIKMKRRDSVGLRWGKLFIATSVVFLPSCRTAPKVAEPLMELPDAPLYPPGLYNHRAALEMRNENGKDVQHREVVAMVKTSPSRFILVLTGPFGIVLASYEHDHVKDERTVKVARRELEAHRARLEAFCRLLESLLNFPRRQERFENLQVLSRDDGGQPLRLQLQSSFGGGQLELGQYAEGDPRTAWPRHWSLETPRLHADVRVEREGEP